MELGDFTPGLRIFVRFEASGYWHDRVLAAEPRATGATGVTPGGDTYYEHVHDNERWVLAGPGGVTPGNVWADGGTVAAPGAAAGAGRGG